jgi:hypothetical protein
VYDDFSVVYAGDVVYVVRDFFEVYAGVAGVAKGKEGFVVIDMLGASVWKVDWKELERPEELDDEGMIDELAVVSQG